jgi:hypothetical protein
MKSSTYLAGQPATASSVPPTVNLEDSQGPQELAAFVRQMPDGPYRKLLEERLASLQTKTRRTCGSYMAPHKHIGRRY